MGAVCPNIHSKEWVDLENAVGKMEAYRSFAENNNTILPVDQVEATIEKRKEEKRLKLHNVSLSTGSIMEIANELTVDVTGTSINVDQIKNTRATELANKMSLGLGIQYQVVSEVEAGEITKNAKKPWSGEAAFFTKGNVYFIKGKLSSDMAVHEFAHPLVRAISAKNPVMFNNLYDGLLNTPEGISIKQHLLEDYPELEEGSTLFKEEAIVKALEKAGVDLLEKKSDVTSFSEVIRKILYHIKQTLRTVFGKKIDISKLNANTTVNELATILTNGDLIEIETEVVSDEDVVSYNKTVNQKIAKELETVENDALQNAIDVFYNKIEKQIEALVKEEKYEELSQIFMDREFHQMKGSLQNWQQKVKKEAEDFIVNAKQNKEKSLALANTLEQLNKVMEKMYLHTEDLSLSPDTQANMNTAHYYNKFINHWSDFIEEFREVLNDPENGVSGNSEVLRKVGNIHNNITKTQTVINGMYAAGARDMLYEQLLPMNKSITRRYKAQIDNLKNRKKVNQTAVDNAFIEFHGMTEAEHNEFGALSMAYKEGPLSSVQTRRLQELTDKSRNGLSISKDKIEQLLKGNLGDANFFNSYLEGYLYNTDPIVGGLALYVKNQMNDVMIVTNRKYNDFVKDVSDDLKAVNYTPTKLGDLGKDLGFKDTVGVWNEETKKFERKEVWTFLNEFKNHRFELDRLKHDVKVAQENYNKSGTDEDQRVLNEAVSANKKFAREYMHQEFVPEYYQLEEIFDRDALGKEAGRRRGNILEEIKLINESNQSQLDQLTVAEDLDLLWRDYRQLYSKNDSRGNPKQGEDAAVAERLREHRTASREFYEFKDKPDAFRNAYLNFQEELINAGLTEEDPLWEIRMEQWKKRNATVTLKPEFYERRNEILGDIKDILAKLPDTAANELDQSLIWEDILELTGGYKDSTGQYKGNEFSPELVASIKELQETLEEMKGEKMNTSGLLPAEQSRLSALFQKQKDKTITPAEKKEKDILLQKQKLNTLSSVDKATLKGLYKDLGELSYNEPTDYYMDQINEWMARLDISNYQKDFEEPSLDKDGADIILTDLKYVNAWMAKDPAFKEWFLDNHIKKEFYNKQGELTEKYDRIYIWNIVKPNDPTLMEQTEIKDFEGNVLDVIDGVPNMSFKNRVVKTKYKTRSIPGVTKNNKGEYLPKTVAQGAVDDKYINKEYEKMKTDDPDMFRLLEKMKKHHIANQEGLDYYSKLGLDFPRYRMSNLEVAINTNLKKDADGKIPTIQRYIKRFKAIFHGDADRAEDGLNAEDRFNLIKADMFDNDETKIHISGLYDIDIDDVSTDIALGMMRYMQSGERQKGLIKASPIAKAIQHTVNNQAAAAKGLDDINKKNFRARTISRFKKKDENVRAQAINNFIAREFDNEKNTGLGSNSPFLNNFANLLFKRASFAFFAFNIPSALKNSLGMKFNQMIEASGGEYVDHISLQRGNIWSYSTMAQLSFNGQMYGTGTKSHDLQMVDTWDMSQGRTEEKFATQISRSAAKDAADAKWFFTTRKWVEIQASLQLGAGMLYHIKINRTMPNGDVIEIPYLEAFETVDGQMRLKSGINAIYNMKQTEHVISANDTIESLATKYFTTPEVIKKSLHGKNIEDVVNDVAYIEADRAALLSEIDLDSAEDAQEERKLLDQIDDINKKFDAKVATKGTLVIDNTEFKFTKNRMHQVSNNMGGAYAEFDQPEAQRYIAFRAVSYMRRYFTTMAVNRWGFSGKIGDPKPRLNPGLGDVQMGFYISTFKMLLRSVKNIRKELPYMTNTEKVGVLKFITEVVMLWLVSKAMGWLFGWDPEDEERYEKLRALSGALHIPGITAEDEDRPFNLLGYAQLHGLHMLMQVRAENEQFNVLMAGPYQYTSLLDLKSVALGPTLDSLVLLLDDSKKELAGSAKADYSRDVGPYEWQQKGGSKFLTHFGKMFGVSGSNVDMAKGIQNLQNAMEQAKVRR